MNSFTFTVESLFDGETFLNDVMVTVEDDVIVAIEPARQNQSEHFRGTLTAGFIDLQVNGGGDALFNASPDVGTLSRIAVAHQQFGTTGWLPTLITDSLDKMELAADTIAKARAEKVAGVLGVHFEGPHLSVAKKGVHNEAMIRELSAREMAIYQRKDLGKVMVTVAPETVSPSVIAQLVENDVIVCLGHSNASCEQTQSAIRAGASGFTHLFNAMSPMLSREPGMVGAALTDANVWAGLIVDGEHVHPVSAQVAVNAKQKIFLVTDAMPPVGSVDNCQTFELYGNTMHREGNRLTDSDGRLAGSMLTMLQAVKNCQSMLGCSLQRSLNMAAYNPAKFLGVEHNYGQLAIGKKASMILLDENTNVSASWVDGQRVI